MVLSALSRGDKVIATARSRSFHKLSDLEARGAFAYELDVDSSQDEMHDFAERIIKEHGQINVLVHNAGTVLMITLDAAIVLLCTNYLTKLCRPRHRGCSGVQHVSSAHSTRLYDLIINPLSQQRRRGYCSI